MKYINFYITKFSGQFCIIYRYSKELKCGMQIYILVGCGCIYGNFVDRYILLSPNAVGHRFSHVQREDGIVGLAGGEERRSLLDILGCKNFFIGSRCRFFVRYILCHFLTMIPSLMYSRLFPNTLLPTRSSSLISSVTVP